MIGLISRGKTSKNGDTNIISGNLIGTRVELTSQSNIKVTIIDSSVASHLRHFVPEYKLPGCLADFSILAY